MLKQRERERERERQGGGRGGERFLSSPIRKSGAAFSVFASYPLSLSHTVPVWCFFFFSFFAYVGWFFYLLAS